MFNFSAYLGVIAATRAGWPFGLGVGVCWLGAFAPGLMLMYGLLPFWGSFRQNQVYRRALPGLTAAAVGLVVMAVFHMYNSFTYAAFSSLQGCWTCCMMACTVTAQSLCELFAFSDATACQNGCLACTNWSLGISMLCTLCRGSSMFPKTSVAIGMIGFYLVDTAKWEPPIVVSLGGLMGLAAGTLQMR